MYSFQTSVTSLVASQNLRANSDFQSRTITRLTSGYRINSAGDDAAGLAVANQFRSNVAELTQGVRNGNDAIGTLQGIDGGLSNVSNILDRLKTLATQSASGTFTGDRGTLDSEFQTLVGEIDRQADNIGLGSTTSTNASSLSVYIGGASPTVTVDLSSGAVDSGTLGIDSQDITSESGATDAIAAINDAISSLGTTQGVIGAGENELGYAVSLAQSQITTLSAANSNIRDADVATEAANLTKAQVLQQSSVAALSQANSAPQGLMKLLQ